MEQSISSSQNDLTCQTKRIRSQELEPTAFEVRKRAIQARSVGIVRSVQASSYSLGGWRSLFEEYVLQPFSANAIPQNPETSDRAIANPASSVETSTSADPHLSRSSNDSSSRESTSSVPDLATMPLCPSGRPEAGEAVVFGVVGGTVAAPQVGYLTKAVPVNEDVLALSGSVEPTEVFRMASTCAGHGCKHFDGSHCRLAMRIVEQLPSVVEALPACQIRPHCRWWQQEGKAACQRCPQLVTDNYYASDLVRQVAAPNESWQSVQQEE
ncbi:MULTISPECIES: hypothetical protein [Cyanophyceae]|uniref:hypothetical protein n=1 Tax=Cyanophyceae TaxID=3028117 RepID=UPI001F54C14F|nr:hypothetical protein [Trichocoleus sp. FACHB-69]